VRLYSEASGNLPDPLPPRPALTLTLLCRRSLDWLERSLDGDGRKIYTHAEKPTLRRGQSKFGETNAASGRAERSRSSS
jgi:hypothetical protein